MEKLRLGIVDVNETIHTDKDGVSSQVRAGFNHLSSINIKTTIATGRGLRRIRELLGEDLNTVVTPGLPISLENGGRLSSRDGKNLRYYRLEQSTISSAIDVVSTNLDGIKFVAYCPKEPEKGSVLWTPTDNIVAAKTEFTTRHGTPGEIINHSILELANRIMEDQACMLIVNFHVSGMENVFSNANMVVNGPELNILEDGTNKGKGVEDIAEVTEVPLVNIFVAGNDRNDVSMLALPVGMKFLVGDTVTEDLDDVIRIPTPDALGEYFKTFI